MNNFFQVKSNNANIYGVWEGYSENYPVLIYCAGINAVRADVHRIAVNLSYSLQKRNISVVRFDYYGLGISDGFSEQMSNYSKFEDVKNIVEFLIENGVSREKLCFLGFSDGAKVAILAARKYNTPLILWSPLIQEDLKKESINRFDYKSMKKNIKNKRVISQFGFDFGLEYFKEYEVFLDEVNDHIKGFNNKGLLIYGKRDEFVIPTLQWYSDTFNGIDWCKYAVEESEHIFSNPTWKSEVINKTTDWLGKIL
ncbi:serine aminopeptidase domain-containing protein [Metabacillus fastidiosus]|uniref:serine aminopeptidase domain-containing protein n=1 Tax=Metabacillus fastidiosus TaxID=1458 RepID=UPI003D28DE1B